MYQQIAGYSKLKPHGDFPMKLATLITSTAALILTASFANAGAPSAGCTKEPQSAWKPASAIESKAVADGYTVSKSKVAGSCYEVYATKGDKRFELFYNPVDATLIETVVK
jgi:hypothetical protein